MTKKILVKDVSLEVSTFLIMHNRDFLLVLELLHHLRRIVDWATPLFPY